MLNLMYSKVSIPVWYNLEQQEMQQQEVQEVFQFQCGTI